MTIRRVRVVSEPLSEYLRWEHACTEVNVSVGEDVRWPPRTKAADLLLRAPTAGCSTTGGRAGGTYRAAMARTRVTTPSAQIPTPSAISWRRSRLHGTGEHRTRSSRPISKRSARRAYGETSSIVTGPPPATGHIGTAAGGGPDLGAQHVMQPGQRAVITPGGEVPVHRRPGKLSGRYRQAHPAQSSYKIASTIARSGQTCGLRRRPGTSAGRCGAMTCHWASVSPTAIQGRNHRPRPAGITRRLITHATNGDPHPE